VTAEDQEGKQAFRKLVAPSAAIVGGLAGAALELAAPGTANILAAAALGPAVEHAILATSAEFVQRQLATREKIRIGGVMAAATIRIDERLQNGESLWDDGFFDPQLGERPIAHEIYEGTLVVAQREHEEKKIPFLGNLLASISFDPEIDRGHANLLLRQAEALSYRQLCILSLLGEIEILAELESPPEDLFVPELREGAYRGRSPTPNETAATQEAWDLQVRSLAYVGPTAMDYRSVNPAEMALMEMGASLYLSMELSEIDREDIEEVAAFFS
jgi:hypothetical protein